MDQLWFCNGLWTCLGDLPHNGSYARQPTRGLHRQSGNANGYYSTIILIPEFQLGVVLLITGDAELLNHLRESITSTFAPLANELLRTAASSRYVGCYKLSTGTDGISVSNGRIELAEDNQRPGIHRKSWTSLGVDFVATYAELSGHYLAISSRQLSWLKFGGLLLYQKCDQDQGQKRLWDDFCAADIDDLSYAGKQWESSTWVLMQRDRR
ncbi:hypothetical protein BGW36DRAFT_433834 [Talaromyces proteolyticus]|uniref:Beta-lactamase-related domain-containing protein n=1 Tax=Talaromyces proteolyticus TaxID=1131652 RepID=A0AAD4KEE0_9EURO|nr:uncharacterized protein BGW36DRAFT_433834 [Talaromyces proteolyticus]KAH8689070.1 hypothetical protein BGW36DRAFT_433834 [Talaromyces proteolyticus]